MKGEKTEKYVRVFSLAALLLLFVVAVLPAAAKAEVIRNDFTSEFGPGDFPPAELCNGEANDFVGGEIDFKTQTAIGDGSPRSSGELLGLRLMQPPTLASDRRVPAERIFNAALTSLISHCNVQSGAC